MAFKFRDYIPKFFICMKEGYSWETFRHDLFAGVSVGMIALPLALAFAIGSGVTPEKGLFTAIIAGFLISFLGGSRVQIGGPTGAFVIIIFEIIQRNGYEGLALATLVGAFMMILMGVARLGVLLKFIPFPVTVGFTTGIAVVIFSSQLKEFFGLEIDKLPPAFLEKCNLLCQFAHTWNGPTFIISFSTLVLIFLLRYLNPKIPGVILSVVLATIAVQLFGLEVTTIQDKFGEIPRLLPKPSIPYFSYDLLKKVFPDAITIALLGSIESLLSAVVADGMTGHKHRSNCELVAQGFANIGSIIFGGIPATGAIARTSANIRFGAKTPVAGMIHALTLFCVMLFLAPYAGTVPLAALSAVLIVVAWNMSEAHHFLEILKGQKGDALVLLITFLLTVLIDLTVAVQVGVLLSAVLFLKHMTDKTTIQASQILLKENKEEGPERDDLINIKVPKDVAIFEIRGPFFYTIADVLDETLIRLGFKPRVFILRLNHTPLIDATGIQAIKKFNAKCQKKGIDFCLSDVSDEQARLLKNAVGEEKIFKKIDLLFQSNSVKI